MLKYLSYISTAFIKIANISLFCVLWKSITWFSKAIKRRNNLSDETGDEDERSEDERSEGESERSHEDSERSEGENEGGEDESERGDDEDESSDEDDKRSETDEIELLSALADRFF